MKAINTAATALAAIISTLPVPASAASDRLRAHCQSSHVSLRLGGCTLVIEDPAEPEANRISAYINRGLAFKVKGAYDRAIADYNEALRLRPGDPLTLNDRGGALRLQGRVEQAIADFNEAIRLNPSFAGVYYNRGLAFLDKGDAKAALADFDEAAKRGGAARAAKAGPDGMAGLSTGRISADYYSYRGHANFILGRFEAAASDYAKAASAQPDNPYFALWRRMALARANRDGAATAPNGEFERAAARLKKTEWPYPVFELYMGNTAPEAVLNAAASPDQVCEAQYYIAQWRLARDERQTESLTALRFAAQNCRKNFIERSAALGELKRMGQ
jgi:tetratricopeptide (TPR) repeat protein